MPPMTDENNDHRHAVALFRYRLIADLVHIRRLEALNRRLWAWVEGDRTPHRSLVFRFEAKRKVQKERTVSLNGVVYEVDGALVGQNVTLRYDAAAPPGRPIEVWHPQQPDALARPLDTYANCFVTRRRPSGTATADTPSLRPEPP
ncbi:MAG: Mu transposase C-terminal domain-containing protein [Gammaproteobacteria bacterium]